jgi:hypothetical protein
MPLRRHTNGSNTLYRLVWAEQKTHASSNSSYLQKIMSYDIILEPPSFLHQKKAVGKSFPTVSWWTIGSIFLAQSIHFFTRTLALLLAIDFGNPHQDHPQFDSTSNKTIPLIHSWCGPSLGMVSTFSFELIVHNCHQFDCIMMSHCTRTTLCKMTNSDDNIKWFH